MFRRVLSDLRPYLWFIVALSAVSLSAIPITLITPVSLKLIVDSVLGSVPISGYLAFLAPSGSEAPKQTILWLAIAILLASTILAYLQSLVYVWFSSKVGNRMTMDMRARLFRQMQRLSIIYHDTKGTADSAYRTLNDAPMLKSFGVDSLIPLVTSVLTLSAMIIVTLFLDPELALIALLVSPFMLLLTVVFRPRIRAGWRKFKTSESAAMAVAQETLGASRVVKAFGQEEQKSKQLVHHYGESLTAQLKVNVDSAIYNLLVGIVTAAGLAAVLYVGILHVEANTLTLGNLLIVNYYVAQLYTPLKNVGQRMLDIQMSLAGMERYHAVLDEKPDVPEAQNAIPLTTAEGRIAFQKVTFEYTTAHPVLQDLSFELSPDSCLGIVGPTGSGKTTITNLLLRFFDPTSGSITLDGIDLRLYKLADLRNQYAVVHQDTVLFSTTITENIRFAKPDASIREVIGAAKAAKAHDFITSLPDGYETLVGERGMKLSGGERQRISLARAFLKNASILILDEPTSALDVHTEAAVLDTIQVLMRGRTTLMIGHRASALRNCNWILVLDDGKITQMTTQVESVLSAMAAVGVSR
ncbi:MAG TPA: ABC transporter ATP-binding protein [Candidatus Angelobacter sp.]|nr:ABC transporter ATP-binding protein [Candidatus Angelobacter sp.]